MTNTILSKIESALKEVCPYEIRTAHSCLPKPAYKRFMLIDLCSINTHMVQAEKNKMRYPLTAVVSVKIIVPFKYGVSELRRIACTYVLPVMADMKFSIAGFTENSSIDKISEGVHTLEIKFNIKGVYTVSQKEEV